MINITVFSQISDPSTKQLYLWYDWSTDSAFQGFLYGTLNFENQMINSRAIKLSSNKWKVFNIFVWGCFIHENLACSQPASQPAAQHTVINREILNTYWIYLFLCK